MAVVFSTRLLLAVLLVSYAPSQQQSDATLRCINSLQLPETVPPTVIETTGCPQNELREEARRNIRQHTGTVLRSQIQRVTECLQNASLEGLGTLEQPAPNCYSLAYINQAIGRNYFTSGYYWIDVSRVNNGSGPVQVYCDLEYGRSCNNSVLGWQRVAYFNTSTFQTDTPCPGDCVRYPVLAEGTDYACGRVRMDSQNQTIASCCSMRFPVYGVPYTHVSGRVYAYKHNRGNGTFNTNYSINEPYVDGVSITTALDPGRPRQHIWTFAASYIDPMATNPDATPPPPPPEATSIIGDNYFCDGADESTLDDNEDLTQYPLWDGESCTEQAATCCPVGNPVFCTMLPYQTNSDIELRVCADGENDEPVFLAEIYIQ